MPTSGTIGAPSPDAAEIARLPPAMTTRDLDGARAELQAPGDHYATAHHSPALAWGVLLDGQLALAGHSGRLDDGAAPTMIHGLTAISTSAPTNSTR